MKESTWEKINDLIQEATDLYRDIYDWDYNETALWHLSEVIRNLKAI